MLPLTKERKELITNFVNFFTGTFECNDYDTCDYSFPYYTNIAEKLTNQELKTLVNRLRLIAIN